MKSKLGQINLNKVRKFIFCLDKQLKMQILALVGF